MSVWRLEAMRIEQNNPNFKYIQTAQQNFNNIVFYNGCVEYAPEIKTVWVFIANKSIKGV